MAELLRDAAEDLRGYVTDLRHRLHRRPEIGLQLPETQATVLAELDGLGLEISTGREVSSVTAVLRGVGAAGGEGGRAVLLRGDMDALPVTEESGEDFSSEIDGVMHACGHDLHTAMLVGAARLLSANRDHLDGDVVFMFQPGEDPGQWGARFDPGLIQGPDRSGGRDRDRTADLADPTHRHL
ncbi:MAG TPA: M20/M25/M40 family metallo-hydrolase [Jatrophihabitans sp.]|jgi:hippurate hydrolase